MEAADASSTHCIVGIAGSKKRQQKK